MPGRRSTAPILRSSGSTYQINGRPFTIVGVASAGFAGAKMVNSGDAGYLVAAVDRADDARDDGPN